MSDPNLHLYYRQPARHWTDALPVGGGRLGAMVFGQPAHERLQLNEDSVWSGAPENADNPEAFPALHKIRELLFQGRHAEAQGLANQYLVCKPSTVGDYGCFQTLCDLELIFEDHQPIADYQRELLLDEGLANVSYTLPAARVRRETFASSVDQVIVTVISASSPGALSLRLALTRPERARTTRADPHHLLLEGRLGARDAEDGMRIAAALWVNSDGQHQSDPGGVLTIRGATKAWILVGAATDYREGDPARRAEAHVAAAAKFNPEQLKSRHVLEHRSSFDRVRLELGSTETSQLPTGERLVRRCEGTPDPSLFALTFNYGRYLLLGSSRPGSLAANLQGLWADGVATPWNCDYHTNINVQMNYWLAETTNLAECALPLLDLVSAMREPGARTARIHYGARGWVVHTIHNIWGFTSPGQNPLWGLSPLSGVWLCQHLFEHYAFSGELEDLAQVFPILREASTFCLDWLVTDPRTGKLVAGPATSPENTFISPEGTPCSISMGPSMDQQIVWDHFTNFLEAALALGIKDELVEAVQEARERLLPPCIGPDGRLLEWALPFEETEPQHRHVSHLFAVHPGRQLTPRRSPELLAAARRSLEARGDHATGWSMAYKICLWARLRDGNRALQLLGNLLTPVALDGTAYAADGAGVYPNLFCAHPPFQIDGNLGATAGIAEMLLQSHDGCIELLPSLPDAWQKGHVSGLRARLGVVVDIGWEEGQLATAVLTARRGGEFLVCYREYEARFTLAPGQRLDVAERLLHAAVKPL